jgi:hypothetical protein
VRKQRGRFAFPSLALFFSHGLMDEVGPLLIATDLTSTRPSDTSSSQTESISPSSNDG